jgi:methionine-rich copper-binding protein CopC
MRLAIKYGWSACIAVLMAMPLVAVLIALPQAAFGHAKLLSTSPAAGAHLGAAPTALTLTFNEAVQLAVLKLSSGGKGIPLAVDRSAAAAPRVSVVLPALGAGTYQVEWSALTADDGHVVKGAFSFVVVGASR